MLHNPTIKDVRLLENAETGTGVSLYIPHMSANASTNQMQIELKNKLREAEVKLQKILDPRQVKKTMRHAKELLESTDLWPTPKDNLALFLRPNFFAAFYLPGEVSESLHVSDSFETGPIQQYLAGLTPFFLLSLNHSNVSLFKGTRYDIKPIHLKDFPSNMHAALQIDEYPKVAETHAVGPASRKAHSEQSHGQYNERQTDKKMLVEFFRRIDKRLHRTLQKYNYPLVIAGAGYLLPIYRKVNTYPRLVNGGIRGNMERESFDVLRRKAVHLLLENDS